METQTRYSDLSGTTKVASTTYTYDAGLRLTNLQQRNGSGTLLSNTTYTYDAASRLTAETRNGTATTYTYDATNQLTHDGTTTYSYDLNGNRTMPGYTTGTGNRLSSDGTWTFSYDDEGNLTGKTKGAGLETWAYTYDHENHLKSVRQTSNGTTDILRVTYSYDSLGQRVQEDKWKTGVGSATTRFAYDGADVWADLDGTNTLQTRYLRGDNVDEVFARIKSTGAAGWYLTDRLGSVRDVTDASGTVVDHLDYSGFGVVTESNASAGDRYKWTGREYDGDTGLQYNRARYFDGGMGRWLSEDPISFSAGDSNLRRYVGNGPTNWTDPDGLDEKEIVRTRKTDSEQGLDDDSRNVIEREARDVLINQINKWRDVNWGFPANLLEYFLSRKSGKPGKKRGIEYQPTESDILEVMNQSHNMVTRIIAGEIEKWKDKNPGKKIYKGLVIRFSGRVRWNLTSYVVGTGDRLTQDGKYKDANDYMFYTYAGANATLEIVVVSVSDASGPPTLGRGRDYIVAEAKVEFEDGYDFPGSKVREVFPEYRAAVILEQPPYMYPTEFHHTIKFKKRYLVLDEPFVKER